MALAPDLLKPWRVVTSDRKTFTRGHTSELDAKKDAAARNVEAEKLGITARYEAIETGR